MGSEIAAWGSGPACQLFFGCSADIWRCQLIRQNKSQQASLASLAASSSSVGRGRNSERRGVTVARLIQFGCMQFVAAEMC